MAIGGKRRRALVAALVAGVQTRNRSTCVESFAEQQSMVAKPSRIVEAGRVLVRRKDHRNEELDAAVPGDPLGRAQQRATDAPTTAMVKNHRVDLGGLARDQDLMIPRNWSRHDLRHARHLTIHLGHQ
ncbi:hypothetical protein GCM10022255_014270 [Dactylosporangium darangshiense]|uniref:Secreted protein n=1 Tax=Dactylosporangium darangshiense TaxID=579108 RepID=A0ABP8D0P5_9ACTN